MATGSSTLVEVGSDGGLVLGTLAGDRATFAALYDRFATRIHDFHLALLRDPERAVEATYQTFERAIAELNHLGDPTQLRPWLYGLAYRLSSHPRWRHGAGDGADGAATATSSAGGDPQAVMWWALPAELTRLDRALLTLRLRHELDDSELGVAVGLAAARVRASLDELGPRLEPALPALLKAHVGTAGKIADDPAPLRTAVPLAAAPPGLRDRVLREIRLGSAHEGLPRPRTRAAWITTVVTVLVLVIGTVLFVHRNLERKPVIAVTFGPSSELTLSTTVVDLGATNTSAALTLSNTGQDPLTWKATTADPWLRVEPPSGSLAGGKSQQLALTANRDTLPEGDGRSQLEVAAASGDQGAVVVALRQERPPAIINPRASHTRIGGYGCPTVSEITATVRDESGPVRVILVGPGQQSQVMQGNGETYTGRLGSGSGSDIAWKVVATDARNNTATSTTQIIANADCAVRPPPPPKPSPVPLPPRQSRAPGPADDQSDRGSTPSDRNSDPSNGDDGSDDSGPSSSRDRGYPS